MKIFVYKVVPVLSAAVIQVLSFIFLMEISTYIAVNFFGAGSLRDVNWGVFVYYFTLLLAAVFIICDGFLFLAKKNLTIAVSCLFAVAIVFFFRNSFGYRPYRTVQIILSSYTAYGLGVFVVQKIKNMKRIKEYL